MLRKGVTEVVIKQGEPMCYVVPYRREEYDLQYVDFDMGLLNKADFNNLGIFDGTTYSKFHREQEKKRKAQE